MEFSVKRGAAPQQKTACLIVGVHTGKTLSAAAADIDKPLRGALTRLVQRGDIAGKPGDTLLLPDCAGIEAERVLLVGCGKRDAASAGDYVKAVKAAAAALKTHKLRSAVSTLLDVVVRTATGVESGAACAAGADAAYRFEEHKSNPSCEPDPPGLPRGRRRRGGGTRTPAPRPCVV